MLLKVTWLLLCLISFVTRTIETCVSPHNRLVTAVFKMGPVFTCCYVTLGPLSKYHRNTVLQLYWLKRWHTQHVSSSLRSSVSSSSLICTTCSPDGPGWGHTTCCSDGPGWPLTGGLFLWPLCFFSQLVLICECGLLDGGFLSLGFSLTCMIILSSTSGRVIQAPDVILLRVLVCFFVNMSVCQKSPFLLTERRFQAG